MANKEVRQLLKKLARQGFDVELTRNGHYKVYWDGRFVGTLAGTPSDHRSLKNSVANLKRAGFQP
ncbi:hypothetical protein ACFW9F_24380 [Streptomyces sp. NPDC059506]|uniref:hypothetical protein n=1 Tax=Streptomyces sp. NPDC059506 TaxID=3347751 RepID=UPI0036847A0B